MTSYDEVMAAVAEGDMKRVCFLVQGEPGILVRPEGGGSLLLTALYRGRQDLVDVLAPRVQMDVFEAAALGDVVRVIQLVKKDPELLRQHSTDGWTALHLAAFMGHRKTAEALLELGAEVGAISKNQMANQPLHASLAGKTDRGVVELLIERAADVNGRGGGGVRPLHLAASRGDGELCELLISKGADVTAKMDDEMTADAIAQKRGHAAVAEQLRRYLP
jgi:ankyrin repeat protein